MMADKTGSMTKKKEQKHEPKPSPTELLNKQIQELSHQILRLNNSIANSLKEAEDAKSNIEKQEELALKSNI